MMCQGCGVEAPTKYVAFYQNIGMLVVRQMRQIEGNLCRNCIGEHFWSLTGWGLLTGWWGTISFVINPFLILNNVIRYLFALSLERPPEGAGPPRLTDDAIARLGPLTDAIAGQLEAGSPIESVAENISKRAGVSPGQVVIYVQALIQASRRKGA
jgi:hypothetical protein